MSNLLTLTDRGLHCPAADIYIDPWKPVERAVITHAHGDHARRGSNSYLCAARGEQVLRLRLGKSARVQAVQWGEKLLVNDVALSLHPAGHILGSAQIRLERAGEVAVISGDYKTEADRTCDPFEPLRCHTFVTESTFGLPIYRWRPQAEVFEEIAEWWRVNAAAGRTSLISAYSLGKAQRVLAGLDPSVGPIGAESAVWEMSEAYREAGIELPQCVKVTEDTVPLLKGRGLIIAPPGHDSDLLHRLEPLSTAFASGWMQIRGQRRWRSVDRGFVLSDHADWNGLLQSVSDTGAQEVWVTHGYTAPLVRWLKSAELDARELKTQFKSYADEAPPDEELSEEQLQ